VEDGRTAPPEDGEEEPEPLGPAGEIRAAAALWRVTCAGCHGVEGHGGGPQLPPMARTVDFVDAEFQAGRTDEQLATVIAQGRGFMPGFGEQINPRGIAALVAHIRRFAPAPEAPPPANPPPPLEPGTAPP
jgi:mono/diheme cytochrome c family protein